MRQVAETTNHVPELGASTGFFQRAAETMAQGSVTRQTGRLTGSFPWRLRVSFFLCLAEMGYADRVVTLAISILPASRRAQVLEAVTRPRIEIFKILTPM